MDYKYTATLWIYPGQAGWYFVSIPKSMSADIKEMYGNSAKGFGSLRVKVKIGNTEWHTSIFPDTTSGCYLLPIKKQVRLAENLIVDAQIKIALTIVT